MPADEYHLDRYHKHRKWMRIHGIITGLSMATVVGIVWAWVFAIRAFQHRSAAKSQKAEVDQAALR